MRGLDLVDRAKGVVETRREQYSPSADLFPQVATRWSLTLKVPVSREQVLLCLVDLKVSRLAANPRHADSLTDLVGYSILLEELVSPTREPERDRG